MPRSPPSQPGFIIGTGLENLYPATDTRHETSAPLNRQPVAYTLTSDITPFRVSPDIRYPTIVSIEGFTE